jgi:hypothetical protein
MAAQIREGGANMAADPILPIKFHGSEPGGNISPYFHSEFPSITTKGRTMATMGKPRHWTSRGAFKRGAKMMALRSRPAASICATSQRKPPPPPR